MQKQWYQTLRKIGIELILNQYTGGPRSECYNNISSALNSVVKEVYDARVFYNSLYR